MHLCFSERYSCWCCDIWQCINWLASNIENLCLASDELNRKQFRNWKICNANDRKLAKQKPTSDSSVEIISVFEWFGLLPNHFFILHETRTKQLNCRLSGIAKPRKQSGEKEDICSWEVLRMCPLYALIAVWSSIEFVSRRVWATSHISDL